MDENEFEEVRRELIEELGEVVTLEMNVKDITPNGIPLIATSKKSVDVVVIPLEVLAKAYEALTAEYEVDDVDEIPGVTTYSISTEPPEEQQD